MKLNVGLALSMMFLAACVDSELSTATQASSNACATNETLGDRVIGFYDASASQTWNQLGVTVYDYRKCSQSLHGGDYLDGAIVANSVPGTVAPAFKPDVAVPYPDGGYRVYAPDTAHDKHKLLVYLSGAPDDNSGKEQLLQRAAYFGYHVVAVRYWNDDGGGIEACGKGPDHFASHHGCTSADDPNDCNPYTDKTPITYDACTIRWYRNTYENASPNFTTAHIGPIGSKCAPGTSDPDLCDGTPMGRQLTNGDAAKYRVRKLLTYLHARHPLDGWGQFAASGSNYDVAPYFDTSKLAYMGHSSGSKVFFHLQHDLAVADRVIFLSGPNLAETRSGSEPDSLDSYVTSPGATSFDHVYAFSNTHDAKFSKALATWRFMRFGITGAIIGLHGATASGGFETAQTCTGLCPICGEFKPRVTDTTMHALQYSGNAAWCVGKGSQFAIDAGEAHEWTTTNATCTSNDPDSCWYINIWDYLLTN